jgi:hypothetical protein
MDWPFADKRAAKGCRPGTRDAWGSYLLILVSQGNRKSVMGSEGGWGEVSQDQGQMRNKALSRRGSESVEGK